MVTSDKFTRLLGEIDKRKRQIKHYLISDEYARRFRPVHIHDATYSYVNIGGKSLRGTVLMLSCGAVGGDEAIALPAAAGIEIFHTWTLVHDDVIDKDTKRRGSPTVHTEYTQRAAKDLGWLGADAEHYGLTIAMLTGDLQQAWAMSLFFELFTKNGVDPAIVIDLAFNLATYVQPTLIEGETLDVQYSNRNTGLSEDAVIDMLWKKTGVLYEFAGRVGVAIGLKDANSKNPIANAIPKFCSSCGTAFQIQDDILGVVGDEDQLGKPVGSDIREGKNTVLTLKLFELANPKQRELIIATLGNRAAPLSDVEAVAGLMRDLGVIDYAQKISKNYVEQGLSYLDLVPVSPYKDLLKDWAEYLIEREF